MPTYIELNRRFLDFTPNDNQEGEYGFYWSEYGAKSWDTILQNKCTIVISEAGSGKSEEFKQQSRKLRAQGKPAFYAALDILSNLPLDKAIRLGSAQELEEWKNGDHHAYFFLDAVDEAKLAHPKDFERGIIRFAEGVAEHRERCTLVISTRPHAWQANADRAMVADRLGLQPNAIETGSVPSDETPDVGVEQEIAVESVTRKVTNDPGIVVVRLAPLDRRQIRVFAAESDVTDVDNFLEAVEQANADAFAVRPADLPALIDRWKTTGAIGKYRSVVQHNIEIKLKETNATHRGQGIAVERALEGAEMLAAAVTFTKKVSFLVPDEQADEAVTRQSIDPAQVLQTWKPEEIRALLGTALFDESLYGTVRFHHRTAREYLCARWLARLLDHRKNRRQIEALLIGSTYGNAPPIAKPSMKPVAAWLALVDQIIRDKLARINPATLLENGDASSLDIGTRVLLLKTFADRYKDRQHVPLRLDIKDLRRLTDAALAPVLSEMLSRYRNHLGVRHMLLRTIREGRIRGFGPLALSYLTDRGMDLDTHTYALQVIGTLGEDNEKREAVAFLTAVPADINRELAALLVRYFWPDHMSNEQVAALLAAAPTSGDFASDSFERELSDTESDNDATNLRALLEILLNLLTTPPLHNREYHRVSERYDWLLLPAGQLAIRMAQNGKIADDDPLLVGIIAMCQQAQYMSRFTADILKDSNALIDGKPLLKRAYFWNEVAVQRELRSAERFEYWSISHGPSLREFGQSDIDWLLADLEARKEPEERRVALSAAFNAYERAGKTGELLDRIRNAIGGDTVLSDVLVNYLSPPAAPSVPSETARMLQERQAEREQKKAENARSRAEWIDHVREHPELIGDLTLAPQGTLWNNTIWLFNEIRHANRKNSSSWTAANWHILIPTFGEKVATAFRDFCIQFWRLYKPRLRSEGISEPNSTPLSIVLGLSGLAMEAVQDGWAKNLTSAEVEHATRYATWELNNFPVWFKQLRSPHQKTVDPILLNEVRWELEQDISSDRSYVLSRLRGPLREISPSLSAEASELLIKNSSGNLIAISDTLKVALSGPDAPSAGLLEHAAEMARRESRDDHRALWITVLLATKANSGLDELRKWLGEPTATSREARVASVLNHLFGDDRSSLAVAQKDYMRVDILSELLALLYALPPTINDDEDDEGYERTRYRPQRAQGNLLEQLSLIPGEPTYHALRKLASQSFPNRDWLLELADRRAETDSEGQIWTDDQPHQFSRDAESAPRTQQDLFDLGLSRLDDLKHEFEEGDESEASLLRKVTDEVELRKSLANRLKLNARGYYSTGSEEELADGKRTDIRLHASSLDERLPIEVKIAGKWSCAKLRERLENQLSDQYMRDARYGIFLLVNREGDGERKRWKLNGKDVNFAELVAWLSAEAADLRSKIEHLAGLEVIGIDLTVLRSPSKRAVQKSARPKSAKKTQTKKRVRSTTMTKKKKATRRRA